MKKFILYGTAFAITNDYSGSLTEWLSCGGGTIGAPDQIRKKCRYIHVLSTMFLLYSIHHNLVETSPEGKLLEHLWDLR